MAAGRSPDVVSRKGFEALSVRKIIEATSVTRLVLDYRCSRIDVFLHGLGSGTRGRVSLPPCAVNP